jgi:AcrR family transcriptional regulator
VTRHHVLAAAFDLVDPDGLDELSLRKLATELDVETMSIYRRVASKGHLLTAVTELIWSEVACRRAPLMTGSAGRAPSATPSAPQCTTTPGRACSSHRRAPRTPCARSSPRNSNAPATDGRPGGPLP